MLAAVNADLPPAESLNLDWCIDVLRSAPDLLECFLLLQNASYAFVFAFVQEDDAIDLQRILHRLNRFLTHSIAALKTRNRAPTGLAGVSKILLRPP